MFTVFSLKKSRSLTAEELRYLFKMLNRYADTEAGKWLTSLLQEREPDFFWSPAMEDGDVMGCFTLLHPRAVYLKPHEQTVPEMSDRIYWIELIFDTVVHELRHMWQWRFYSVFYILCALPGLRQLTLERDAKAVENDARRFAKAWTVDKDRAEYIARYGRPPEPEER